MGNKIITEKDFWKCDTGAVPAQFQSTQMTVKKISGEKYITVRDTATSSWIDFGCTRLMLIYAIIAAAVVVIAAMTVATGGAALIALGALAGLAGAAWGAIVGTLLCGQIAAKARKWVGSKKDYIVQGVQTITGDHIMTCPVGGTIKFAPEIKSWSQAVALGFANYLGKLMEGAMAGAAIGMAGAAVAGGAGAFASGGMRGVGQAAWQFAKSMPKNFLVNAYESIKVFGLGLRGVMGAQNVASTYGNTGEASGWDFLKGTVAMETGAWDSANVIYSDMTGGVMLDENGNQKHAGWQDYVGMALMFSPIGQGKRDLENKLKNEPKEPVRDTEGRADDAEGNRGDEEGNTRAENVDGEGPRQEESAAAYAATRMELVTGDPPFRRNPDHNAAEFQRQIEGQEAGMNSLTVEDFINNRDAYLENGRSHEGSTAQQRYREQFKEGMIDDLMENEGLSYDEAEARTDAYMSDKAALHDPDQIAGGHGDNITGLGDSRVNSSLGSQWKTRIREIDRQVREQAAGMTPEQRANTYLNIRLPWE
ncbi:hypothetical protein DRF65_13780 [Chryseobacterium pennae]|uniref:Novel toxin 15 domain-containing protein n=1 Tax=Chryseobacterium pennae TaxID=2258962 RepID=A0A3D9C7S6_9FLAO|nr:polymorphic toxin type 15 domain-containing protein [Chryseobacterium pennae]REC61804.1 hypothetical protein DRF65_13780 [Chryseobacterium pennae]